MRWENFFEEQERYPLHQLARQVKAPRCGGGRAVMTVRGPPHTLGGMCTAAFPTASTSVRERRVSDGHSGTPPVNCLSHAQSCRGCFSVLMLTLP